MIKLQSCQKSPKRQFLTSNFLKEGASNSGCDLFGWESNRGPGGK